MILCEFVLMAILDFMISFSSSRFQWVYWLKDHYRRVQSRLERSRWNSLLLKLGWLGPLTITALPFAGGVWSGMAFARLLSISRKKTIVLVGVGAILGCALFAMAALGILTLVEIPVYQPAF